MRLSDIAPGMVVVDGRSAAPARRLVVISVDMERRLVVAEGLMTHYRGTYEGNTYRHWEVCSDDHVTSSD